MSRVGRGPGSWIARRPELAVLLLVMVVAGLVRAVYHRQLASSPYATALVVDEELYDERARAIVGGDFWLGERPYYQDPLYPYLLAVVYWLVGHDLGIVRLLQSLAGVAATVAVAAVATRASGPISGLVAGLLYAIAPSVLFYDGHIEKTGLCVSLVAGLLWLAARAVDRPARTARWLLVGFSLGILALLRGNFLALIPFVVLAAAVVGYRTSGVDRRRRGRLLGAARVGALVVVAAAAAILPFTLRNLVVAGEPVLVTSQGGQNFYLGNWPGNDTGMYVSPPWVRPHPRHEEVDFARAAEQAVGRRLSAREVSRHYWDLTLAEIGRRPLRFVRLTALRLAWALNPDDVPDNYDLRFMGGFVPVLAILPGTIVLLALGIPGLAAGARVGRPGLRPLLAYVVLYLGSVIPFFVFGRYRAPILPALAVGAGVAVAAGLEWARDRRYRRLAAGVGMVSAVTLGLWLLPTPPDYDGQSWNNLGTIHERLGNIEAAAAAYRAADARDNPLGSYNVGRLLVAAGRHEQALARYRKSLQRLPDRPETHANLGACLLDLGRDLEAVAALERALTLDPAMAEAWFNLGLASARLGRPGPAVAQLRQAARLAGLGSDIGRRAQLRAARIEATGATAPD